MIRRPLNSCFNQAVRDGRKTTTIRIKPWPLDVPVMLYNWAGKPYRSPQQNAAIVIVQSVQPITLKLQSCGTIVSFPRPGWGELWQTEGFDSQQDFETWFRPLFPKGLTVMEKFIHTFKFCALTVMLERRLTP